MEKTNLKYEIGQRVRQCRLKAGYTQAQCAKIMDISVNFLSEIETGKKGMSQDTLYQFCKQFQISADYLLFGSPDTKLTYSIIKIVNSLSTENLSVLMDYIVALQNLQNSVV